MVETVKEQTLVVIKPDGVQRGLIGEIIARIERTGLKLVGLQMVVPAAEFVRQHYTLDPQWLENVGNKSIAGLQDKGIEPPTTDPIEAGTTVLNVLVKYMTSGPVVAMVWQGAHSVGIVRKLVGGTEPLSSDVGTIRGDFVIDSYPLADGSRRAVRNLVHASGSPGDAQAEIAHWFAKDSVMEYRLVHEQILYDVNLDGILE
jgi:nucleoside-diphosphate kinase